MTASRRASSWGARRAPSPSTSADERVDGEAGLGEPGLAAAPVGLRVGGEVQDGQLPQAHRVVGDDVGHRHRRQLLAGPAHLGLDLRHLLRGGLQPGSRTTPIGDDSGSSGGWCSPEGVHRLLTLVTSPTATTEHMTTHTQVGFAPHPATIVLHAQRAVRRVRAQSGAGPSRRCGAVRCAADASCVRRLFARDPFDDTLGSQMQQVTR